MQIIPQLLLGPVLFLTLQAHSQDSANTYTLQQCIEIGIKNNPDVINAQFQVETADANLQQAKANKLPYINGSIGHNIYNGRSINIFTNSYTNQQYLSASYGLSASITLWSGSSIQNYIRQIALGEKASEMDVQQAKDKLALSIVLYYLSVLSSQAQLNMMQQQLAATVKKVAWLETKNKAGAISPSDFYDMQGQLATDKLAIATTKNNLETAKLTLVQAMNISYTADIKLIGIADNVLLEPYTATVNEIYDHAAQNLAVVKAADIRKESTLKLIETAKGKILPTLSLAGGLYTNYSSTATLQQLQNTADVATTAYILTNNTKTYVYSPQSNYVSEKIDYGNQWKNNVSSAIGLNLSIPILNGLQAKSNIKLAKINDRQADLQLKTIKVQLRRAIEKDFVNMNTSYEVYKASLEQVQAYSQSLQAAESRFNAGAISTTDYLIVKNNYDRAAINLTFPRYDYIFKTKILDFYLGN